MASDSFVGDGLTPSPYKLVKAELEAEKETIAVVHLRDPKDIKLIAEMEEYIKILEKDLHIR